jgi:hypothetical protein
MDRYVIIVKKGGYVMEKRKIVIALLLLLAGSASLQLDAWRGGGRSRGWGGGRDWRRRSYGWGGWRRPGLSIGFGVGPRYGGYNYWGFGRPWYGAGYYGDAFYTSQLAYLQAQLEQASSRKEIARLQDRIDALQAQLAAQS